jgi:hypothetical protein
MARPLDALIGGLLAPSPYEEMYQENLKLQEKIKELLFHISWLELVIKELKDAD